MKTQKGIFSNKARIASLAIVVGSLAAAMAVGTNTELPSRTAGKIQQSRKSTDPPMASRGKMGQDLFLAIDHRDNAAVQALLKGGADPNSRNGLEFTPLYIAAASHQPDVMDSLIKAGAKPDAKSTYGTPLMFAAATAHAQGVKLLISLGANVNAIRTDGMTPLMMASLSGSPVVVGELLKNKADVSVKDDGGATALSLAARAGNTPVVSQLIDAGADVNSSDVDEQTPLMAAAVTGHADIVSALLKKGAKPNAKDAQGRTALILAASYGDYPDVAKALLAGNANPKGVDSKGRSAATIAASRGYKETVTVLAGSNAPAADRGSRTPTQALSASLKLLQSSMKTFTESATCVSCHHEGLARITTAEAKDRGFSVDKGVEATQKMRLSGMLVGMKPLHEAALKDAEVMKQLPLIEINEVSSGYVWLLAGMAAQKQEPTDATGLMTMALAKQQSPDGHWSFSMPRTPMQSSFFTLTSLAVQALSTYGPKAERNEVNERIGRAREWMLKAPAQTSEDRASRLLGLKWAGADEASRKDSIAAILAEQRPDGGWSQLPGIQSDAYATGQALYALHVGGGVSTSDPVYQRGVQFLLRTQDDDGSWFTVKRAMPANNYFDSGFPHGESQYASFNATNWASLALLETIAPKH